MNGKSEDKIVSHKALCPVLGRPGRHALMKWSSATRTIDNGSVQIDAGILHMGFCNFQQPSLMAYLHPGKHILFLGTKDYTNVRH